MKPFLTLLTISLLCSCASTNILKQAARTDQKDFSVPVLYRQMADKRFYITAKVNGEDMQLLFDTGSATGHIPLDTAKKLNMSISFTKLKQFDITGLPHRSAMARGKAEIGGIKMDNVIFTTSDANPYFILGYKPMSAFNWLIDPTNGKVLISDTFFKPTAKNYFSFEYVSYLMPRIRVHVEGVDQYLGFDYGATDEMILASGSPLGEQLLKEYAPKPEIKTLFGPFGKRDNVAFYKVVLPELNLGTIKIKDVKVIIIEGGSKNLLGSELLSRYRMIINSNYRKQVDTYHQMIIEEL